MKITAVCIMLLALVACSKSGVNADTASVPGTKEAKIEELLNLMKVEQLQKQSMDQMEQMITSQIRSSAPPGADTAKMEEKQKKVMALITDKVSWQGMKPTYIKIYSETYADSEVDGMLLFYRSTAGKAMVDKQPELMTKIMSTMQTTMKDLTPQIEKIMTE